MARTIVNKPSNVVERNLALTGEFTRYLLEHPHILQTLPEQFEVVILPEDDPEMRTYNLELLDQYGAEDKPVVFVRMRIHAPDIVSQRQVNVYAPIAA
jgi:hypothetical protein